VAVTEGPFITLETPPGRADVGVGSPIRVRVEDAQGVSLVNVLLGDEVVWSPDVLPAQKVVYTSYPWIPDTTGDYTFRVVAHTVDGREAEQSFKVKVGCCPPTGAVNIGYTVQPGDDPASIAAGFGVCLNELEAVNPNLETIAPGDILVIPYRPGAEGEAGQADPDACAPAPEGFFENPQILQDIPRREGRVPVAEVDITRGFGCAEFYTGYRGTDCPADQPWFHTGIDYSTKSGAPITTVDGGTVTYAGPDVTSNAPCENIRGSESPHNGYGRHVRIALGDYVFLYAHLSAITATSGQDYDGSGLLLGYAGSTGCSTGPHLHLEVRQNGKPIDPELYINQP
jgi:hypothetical protein